MKKAVIVSTVRTAVGKFRGGLATVEAHKLAAAVIKEAVERAKLDKAEVEDVVFGNLFANEIANVGRMSLLEAGLPITVPGCTIDRQCSSSLNALMIAAMAIESGHAQIMVAGGVESDSRRPYVVEKPTADFQASFPKVWDLRFRLSPEAIGDPSMIITAENVAKKYNVSRKECDEFAVWSHQKAAAAWEKDIFKDQIVPIVVKGKKGETVFKKDEPLRPDASLETMSKLKPVSFEGGVVTAGNASPLSDGAGAMVVMEQELAKARGLEVMAEVVDFAVTAVDPNIMGIGPISSIQKLLKKTNLTVNDIDLFEINEAFAAQCVPCARELNLDLDRLNVNGGAIALGHPLAGTGAILVAKMVYEMKRRDAHRGIISFCIGGGQGAALLLERN